MSDELTIWERPVHRRGFVAGATAAALTAAGLGRFGAADALAAAEAEGTLFYYNWAQYVNPKTYAAFTKATGIKVKKAFYDSNETLAAKLRGGARGYDLVCPTGYMTKELIAEKRLLPLDWSQLKNVTKNADPKFLQDVGRSEGHVLGREGLGDDRLHVPDRQDQGATDELERVRRAHEEVRKDDDGRLVPGGRRLDRDDARVLVQHREPEGARPGQEGPPRPEAVTSSRSTPPTTTLSSPRGRRGWVLAGTATALALAGKVPAQYVVAKEGGEIWIDYYNIPAGAANPDAAHAWIDFVYQPKIAGLETSYSYYGSPLKRSLLKGTAAGKLLGDKVVFPPPATVKKLETNQVSANGKRLRERIWTEFKAS